MRIQYTPNDKWSQRAQSEGFRARSIYKLQELDEKYGLFKRVNSVLDIGAFPGSWLQYAVKKIPNGTIVGIDLEAIEPIPGVITHVADITDFQTLNTLFIQSNTPTFPLIISDLAPKTSGIKDIDQWKSIELSEGVLEAARHYLHTNGTVVFKILRGADFDDFYRTLKLNFKRVHMTKVAASRDTSREVYVVARGPLPIFFKEKDVEEHE